MTEREMQTVSKILGDLGWWERDKNPFGARDSPGEQRCQAWSLLQGRGQGVRASVVCPHGGTRPGAVSPAMVAWQDPVPEAQSCVILHLGVMMAFLAVPHSRVRDVQQLPASSSSQHPSSFCSRCKTRERCLNLDPCFSALSPGFIFCLLSKSLTWLRCAQSCPAWQGIPLAGAELCTSPPSRKTTAPSPGKEGGRGRRGGSRGAGA